MEYNINIREELFGGTLLNFENGKRSYINSQELKEILENDKLPRDLISENVNKKNNIKFTSLDVKKLKNFSFADIAFIEITRACNLRCKHCLNNSGEIINNQLTTEEIFSLIKKLAMAGIQEIRFTGGEPLVHKDIYRMIELATNLGIYTSIGTNGTLIDKKVAKKLKDVGLKKAVVSLDGTRKKHDEIRGKGNYDKTILSIKYLQEQGIQIKINSVIMRSNIEDVIILAKKLNKMKIDVFIRRFIESGRGEKLEKFKIITSKTNIYTEQVKKLKEESKLPTKVIYIEDLIDDESTLLDFENSIIYFLCYNSPLVSTAIKKLESYNCYIINKQYLTKNYLKLDVQILLDKNNINVPKTYAIENIENIKFPIFCKENRHEGIIIQVYNKITLTRFFEKFNTKEFYLEETINNNKDLKEFKVYFVDKKIFLKDVTCYNKILEEMCKKISVALNNLEVFSVDIVQNTNGELFVIDVNPSAGFYLSDDGRRYFLDRLTKK